MKILELLAKLCSVLSGILLTFITLMTCYSLIGRNTTGDTIVGDFELTGVATGAAIALFMPLCQLKKANIIVDFFTAKASEATIVQLDRLGALFMAMAFGLLAWRTYLGGMNAWISQSGSMMLGFPEWIVYAAMTPPLVLSGVIALAQAIMGEKFVVSEGAAA
ncbi:MAG: TRAP transporter small permease [Limnohabitans sp.]|jgi:TRAP-type C4-dicarboxylate transport system permease small subunit|nr:TRAP transporter small permease [Limnohabitans sp.]